MFRVTSAGTERNQMAIIGSVLAGLPAGAATPTWGVVLFAGLFLVAVIGINAAWELITGPPNP
jgi:hypothetical protein